MQSDNDLIEQGIKAADAVEQLSPDAVNALAKTGIEITATNDQTGEEVELTEERKQQLIKQLNEATATPPIVQRHLQRMNAGRFRGKMRSRNGTISAKKSPITVAAIQAVAAHTELNRDRPRNQKLPTSKSKLAKRLRAQERHQHRLAQEGKATPLQGSDHPLFRMVGGQVVP